MIDTKYKCAINNMDIGHRGATEYGDCSYWARNTPLG